MSPLSFNARLAWILTALLLAAACAPRTPMPGATARPAATATAETAPTALPTVNAPSTPEPALEPRPTPVAVGTRDPATTDRHLRIFEQLWNTVDTQYVYPDFGGIDWSAAYDEFQARIERGLSDEAFWKAMSELVARLSDDHSTFLTPEQAREEDEKLSGNLFYVGIGIYAAVQTEKKQAVIFSVFPGSPAQEAGLSAHDALLSIDGQPVVNADGSDALDRLRGPADSVVTLTVRSPSGAPRDVEVTRRRVNGALTATGRALRLEASERRIGYLMIPTLWDASIERSTRQALIDLTNAGALDGLIIDMRVNGGGTSANLLSLLGFFTAGQHGEFAGRDQTRLLQVTADPVGNSHSVPLVILVGSDTQSYAEVFSGVLREAGRAHLVGQTTAGNIETLYGYDFEDGSRAWIARETFVPLGGDDWEATGLAPDVPVDADWDEFTDADDPYIAAALDLLNLPVNASRPSNR